ncbi:MAG: AmmeMemoRadiSam system protein B [Nitrospinota bacterium]
MEIVSDIRRPAVAGSFYPGDAGRLMFEVEAFMSDSEVEPRRALGAISPHAGYYYSGHVAGALFGALEVPDRVILIGPNHSAAGARAALDESGGWSFPFGVVPVNRELSYAVARECPSVEFDSAAHKGEHSLEVIVPFLYARNPDVSIAAMVIYSHQPDLLSEIAEGVAKAAKQNNALVVASSDMTHYLPDKTVREIDGSTIEVVRGLDSDALLEKVKSDQSMCGAAAVSVTMSACKKNGASRADLVKYATSGDIEGKRDSVVGYAGFMIRE